MHHVRLRGHAHQFIPGEIVACLRYIEYQHNILEMFLYLVVYIGTTPFHKCALIFIHMHIMCCLWLYNQCYPWGNCKPGSATPSVYVTRHFVMQKTNYLAQKLHWAMTNWIVNQQMVLTIDIREKFRKDVGGLHGSSVLHTVRFYWPAQHLTALMEDLTVKSNDKGCPKSYLTLSLSDYFQHKY